MKPALAPTVRVVTRSILASSIASFLLAGAAHAVSWPADLPPGGVLTLGVDLGGDDVDLLADTVVTLDGAGGTLLENIIVNLGTASVTTLTVNNAAGAARTLAANATVLGGDNGTGLVVAGSADFRIGAVSDGGFANMELVKNGGPGELILDNLNNDLDGAALRVVSGTVSIEGGGGTASPIDSLLNAIRIDGAAAKLRLGTSTAPGTTFNNNLVVNDSGTLEHTAASHDTLSGLVSLAAGRTLTANVTNGSLTLSGAFTRGGSSNLTKTGAGTLYLSGFGSGTGLTNVSAGTLQYAIPGALYAGVTGSWTPANITVESGATLAVNVGGASDFTTGNVTTLLTGLSTVNNNGLKAGASFGFDTSNATGTVTYANALTNSTGPGGGAVGFTKLGLGTLSLSGTNTYTGTTMVSSGTLQFAKLASLYGGTAASWVPANIHVASGATLALNVGGSGEFDSTNLATLLDGSHLGNSTVSTGLRSGAILGLNTVSAAGGTFSYNSAIANPNTGVNVLHLTKLGTGTLSLGGVNTYSGTTTISAGTLALGAGGALTSSSEISLAAGATFDVSAVPSHSLTQPLSAKGMGTANVAGALHAGAQTINLQDAANIGTLALGSTLTLSGATLRFDLSATTSDRITVSGNVTMSGTNIIDVTRLASTTGLATGTQAYTLITAGGGLVSSGFSLSSSFITIGSTNYTLTLSGDATHQYLGVTSGSVALPTTYTLANSVSAQNIRVSTGTSTITTTITNTGTTAANNDSLSYSSLGSTAAPATGVTLVPLATGGVLAPNLSGTAQAVANQTFSSTVAGSYLLTASGGVVTNTTVGGAPTLQGSVGSATINVYRLAAPSPISTPLTFSGNHHVGDVVAPQTLSLTNTATADGFSEQLDAAFTSSTGGAIGTGSIGLLAAGASNATSLQVGIDTGTVGAKSGTVTVGLTSNGSGTSGLGTFPLAQQVITVNAGSVYRLAAPGAINETVSFAGNLHVGDVVPAQALSLTNEAAADGFSEHLDAAFTGSTGGATGSGMIPLLAPEGVNLTSLLVGLDTSTVGAKSGTVTVGLTSNGAGTSLLGTTALAPQVITVNAGTVFRLAAPATNLAGMPVDLGRVHVNGAFGTAPLSISNTALADGFSEGLNAAFGTTDGASHNSGTIGNLAAGATNGASLAVGLGGSAHTGTAGVVSGTVTLVLASNGTASGLPDTNLTPEIITVTGFVYSGLGTWNLDGGGNWSTIANWQASGGVPGLDAGFTATDTATFGGSASSTNPTVSLNGVSPNLKALAFNNASQSYTLNASGGGVLKLDNATGIATVTATTGDHTIGAPIELASDATVSVANSGDVLTISGNITQSGTHGLTKTGSGTLNLTGGQSYATLTSTAGTTNVDGVMGSGGASVTVNNPGTVLKFGSVSQTLSSLSIGAGATVIFNSGAASLSGGTAKAAGLGDGAVVPEPGTLGLLMVGVLGILGRRRRTP